MVKFSTLPKSRLRSGAHFTIMEAFSTRLTAADFTAAKLKALVDEFQAALAEEDKYLKQSTASEYSKQLADVDAERDKYYMLIKQAVNLWAAQTLDPQATAAKALKTIVDLYKIDIHDQYDQETGLITNFVTDMEDGDKTAHVATLGLTDALALLKENNEQMKTLMASRTDERTEKETGALKAARNKVNDIYDQIVAAIEGYALLADDTAPYEKFIATWNTEITRIRQQIGLKATSSSSSSSSSTSGSGGSSSSDGDDSGSSSSGDSDSGSSSSGDSDSSSSSGDSGSSGDI